MPPAAPPLSIITLGHVHEEDIVRLSPHFSRIEQLVLDVAPRDPLSKHRAEVNRAIDAATADWVLIVREREVIDEALAKEIGDAAVGAKARGFRIRATPFYAGAPLHLKPEEGEVRLFHRRYYLRFANKGEWNELMVQGTVVRLANALRSITFTSTDAHRQYLAENAKPKSAIARLFRFAAYWLSTRVFDRNTIRYLWIEAGYE